LYNFVIIMLHAFIYLCERFQMKCSTASDVLTLLALLLSICACFSCIELHDLALSKDVQYMS